MALFSNRAESGQADGTTVTAANSGGGNDNGFDSGDPFFFVSPSTTSFTFDNTHTAHGSHAYKWVSGASAGTAQFGWRRTAVDGGSLPSSSRWYGRMYLWGSTNPNANWGIVRWLSAGATGTICCTIQISTTGKIRVLDTAGTVRATSTNSITLSAWNRIEFDFTFSTTVGQYIVSLFAVDSTSATETLTGTSNHNLGAATADTVLFMNPAGANIGVRTWWFDDININTTGLPGPAGIAATFAGPLGALTGTIAATPTVVATFNASLGGLTATVAATPKVNATLSASLGSLQATAAAVPKVNATLAAPLGSLTASVAATPVHPATLAAPLGSLAATAAATPKVNASLAAPLGSLAATASATPTVPATLSAPLGGLTGTVAAKVTVPATAASLLGSLNATIAATPVHPVSFSAPLGSLAATAAFQITHAAVLQANLGGLTATASAGIVRTAAFAAALGPLTATAVASVVGTVPATITASHRPYATIDSSTTDRGVLVASVSAPTDAAVSTSKRGVLVASHSSPASITTSTREG